jgi:hypothetical protein
VVVLHIPKMAVASSSISVLLEKEVLGQLQNNREKNEKLTHDIV